MYVCGELMCTAVAEAEVNMLRQNLIICIRHVIRLRDGLDIEVSAQKQQTLNTLIVFHHGGRLFLDMLTKQPSLKLMII